MHTSSSQSLRDLRCRAAGLASRASCSRGGGHLRLRSLVSRGSARFVCHAQGAAVGGRGAVASAGNFCTSCVGGREARARVPGGQPLSGHRPRRQPKQRASELGSGRGAQPLVGLWVVHPGMSWQYLLQPLVAGKGYLPRGGRARGSALTTSEPVRFLAFIFLRRLDRWFIPGPGTQGLGPRHQP